MTAPIAASCRVLEQPQLAVAAGATRAARADSPEKNSAIIASTSAAGTATWTSSRFDARGNKPGRLTVGVILFQQPGLPCRPLIARPRPARRPSSLDGESTSTTCSGLQDPAYSYSFPHLHLLSPPQSLGWPGDEKRLLRVIGAARPVGASLRPPSTERSTSPPSRSNRMTRKWLGPAIAAETSPRRATSET